MKELILFELRKVFSKRLFLLALAGILIRSMGCSGSVPLYRAWRLFFTNDFCETPS